MANEMQKMREAVNVRTFRKIAEMLRRLVDHIRKEKSLSENLAREAFDQVDDLAIEALIDPPRNCDVGTADEQMKRQYDTMCNTINACPDPDWSCRKCFAQWAQMPYEAQEGGAQ